MRARNASGSAVAAGRAVRVEHDQGPGRGGRDQALQDRAERLEHERRASPTWRAAGASGTASSARRAHRVRAEVRRRTCRRRRTGTSRHRPRRARPGPGSSGRRSSSARSSRRPRPPPGPPASRRPDGVAGQPSQEGDLAAEAGDRARRVERPATGTVDEPCRRPPTTRSMSASPATMMLATGLVIGRAPGAVQSRICDAGATTLPACVARRTRPSCSMARWTTRPRSTATCATSPGQPLARRRRACRRGPSTRWRAGTTGPSSTVLDVGHRRRRHPARPARAGRAPAAGACRHRHRQPARDPRRGGRRARPAAGHDPGLELHVGDGRVPALPGRRVRHRPRLAGRPPPRARPTPSRCCARWPGSRGSGVVVNDLVAQPAGLARAPGCWATCDAQPATPATTPRCRSGGRTRRAELDATCARRRGCGSSRSVRRPRSATAGAVARRRRVDRPGPGAERR